MAIPITVFTGFLGAGKTSIILSLLPQLPKDYKVVLLKNEFGDIEVDSKLAQQSSLAAVSEILNGCMCCVLVGQMQNAILEIRDKYRPDRIIIECSGSAFPATLAFQIRELERQTEGDIKLDAIVTVVDAENFVGYEDTSPTNKWELVDDRKLDEVLDHLHTLNDLTPKIRCQGRNGVDPNLIFGVESKLFLEVGVETVSLYAGYGQREKHQHNDHCHCLPGSHTPAAIDQEERSDGLDEEVLTIALGALSKESIWRVKGLVRLRGKGMHILNWAFGRFELTALGDDSQEQGTVKLTVMGERGEVRRAIAKFKGALDATVG
ncbi:CobW/HypB/UreG, nucleotide-binding domain-containing protein [Mycena olivaceomarginata]|nr:CobW/HypB/UreG, nucleotide-binding domain-containing protein [Mycena olivaceomarginata]